MGYRNNVLRCVYSSCSSVFMGKEEFVSNRTSFRLVDSTSKAKDVRYA